MLANTFRAHPNVLRLASLLLLVLLESLQQQYLLWWL